MSTASADNGVPHEKNFGQCKQDKNRQACQSNKDKFTDTPSTTTTSGCESQDTEICSARQATELANQRLLEQQRLEAQQQQANQLQQEQNDIANQQAINEIQSIGQDQGTSDSTSGSSGGSSTSDSTSEDKDLFFAKSHDILGLDSHLFLMQQDKGVGLYRIVSDEKELDTGVLPQTIRLVQSFSDEADAFAWLGDYDDSQK